MASTPGGSGARLLVGLILPVYLPTFLLSFGEGVLVPTLPLYAQSFGLSFSLVSAVVAASGLGTVIADIPAGLLLERIGRRPAMLIGVAALALCTLAMGLAHVYLELIVYRVVAGIGAALWNISRHTYVTDVTAPHDRGRALAVFGGVGRLGFFAGPVVGGALGELYGLRVPILGYAALAGVVFILSVLFVPEAGRGVAATRRTTHWRQVGDLLVQHARTFTTAGAAQVFAQMIRAGRHLLIPLYGAAVLNLDVGSVGLILTIAAAIDMVMFIPAGLIMDRFGRKYASVPCFLIMAIGMGLIPLSTTFLGLLVATTVMSLGNGLGSGSMMTLGADLAPRQATGEFLGIWRLIGDVGSAAGPLVVGNLADLFGLSAAAFALAGIGLLATITLAYFVPETLEGREQ
ncbi:MAG: MFS transporter [Candidatus Latescibacteria bacterium]|nr:MFS transporter [Candidatus Latescibacterota bacterium]